MAITFSITYAGLTIGGSSAYYQLHCAEGEAPMRLTKNNDTFTLAAHVVCRGSTVAEFTTKADALEVAWRTLAGDLSYTFGSSTTSFSQASNTGMNAQPSIEKVGSLKFDSDRSRLYRVSVSLTLPADASGKNGLRRGEVMIATDNVGRFTASISGALTALSSNDAYTQAAVIIASYVTSIPAALSVTMQSVEPRWVKYDDRNKVATFTHTLREILSAESSGGLDHASIVTQQFVIERGESYPGDHDGNGPPVRLTASYSADITKTVTDLPSFWNGTIRPWIISRCRSIAAAGSLAILEVRPSFDLWNNRVGAQVVMLACVASTWERRITTETEDETEVRFTPVWNGQPYARHKYEGAAFKRMRVTETVTRLGGSTGGSGGSAAGGLGAFFGFGGQSGQIQVPSASGFGFSTQYGFFGANGGGTAGLGQIQVGGGSGGGASQAPASTSLGGVQIPKGFELRRNLSRSYPVMVGSPEARYLATVEYREQMYEYAEPVSSGGSGGGSGAGGLTSNR